MIAVPLPEPGKRTLDQIGAAHADCGATVVLTTERGLERQASIVSVCPQLAEARWIATDRLPSRHDDQGESEPEPAPDDVAFLQYTSGSTSDPRGVIVRHENLTANIQAMRTAFEMTDESVFVTWLPPFHDMGLVGALLLPIYVGVPAIQMSPRSFLQRPVSWLETISQHRGTHSAAPDSAYDLCARRISPQDRSSLDLRSWRVAVNGAEPVRHATMDRFSLAFAPSGFRAAAFCPSYGLAESTLMVACTPPTDLPVTVTADPKALARDVSSARPTARGARRLASSGRCALERRRGSSASVVHRLGTEIGESGFQDQKCRPGYWNRPSENVRSVLADSGEVHSARASASSAPLATRRLSRLKDDHRRRRQPLSAGSRADRWTLPSKSA